MLEPAVPAVMTRPATPPLAINRRNRIQIVALLGLLTAIHLLSLLRFPAAFEDEGWLANRAWGLLHTGWAFGTVDSGVFENYPHYERFFFWLCSALTAPALALFGPTLLAVRLVSLLFGLVLLVVIYYIAVQLYDHYTGLLAVGLLGLSVPFFQMAHLGRQDITVAAFGYGAVACYLSAARSGRAWQGFLAGLLATLTLDIHPSGAIFIAALGLLCLRDYGLRVVQS
ncbi:MAG: glycosyltransferase family 39 protein, partial [Chloroflexota bacterium]|nr:glycosyltransferase family 39 protein [Chloroflexota bacterium]